MHETWNPQDVPDAEACTASHRSGAAWANLDPGPKVIRSWQRHKALVASYNEAIC